MNKNILDFNQSSHPVKANEFEKSVIVKEALNLEIVYSIIDDGISLMKERALRGRLKEMGIQSRESQNAYINFIAQYIKEENQQLKHTQKERVRYELQNMYENEEDTKNKIMILDRLIKLDGLAEPTKSVVANLNVEWGKSE